MTAVPELPNSSDITRFLVELEAGDTLAADRLMPLVYDDLRRLAASLRRSRGAGTLQPTALVHEAYLRLLSTSSLRFKGRPQFFKLASMAMRQILADYAKGQRAEKRGGRSARVPLDAELPIGGQQDSIESDLVRLDEALTKLAQLDERQAHIVELRFFAGLPVKEVAELVGVSIRTVELDWQMARKWLHAEVQRLRDAGAGR